MLLRSFLFSGGVNIDIRVNAALDFSVLFLKLLDIFTNKNKNMTVHRTSFIVGNIAYLAKHFLPNSYRNTLNCHSYTCSHINNRVSVL